MPCPATCATWTSNGLVETQTLGAWSDALNSGCWRAVTEVSWRRARRTAAGRGSVKLGRQTTGAIARTETNGRSDIWLWLPWCLTACTPWCLEDGCDGFPRGGAEPTDSATVNQQSPPTAVESPDLGVNRLGCWAPRRVREGASFWLWGRDVFRKFHILKTLQRNIKLNSEATLNLVPGSSTQADPLGGPWRIRAKARGGLQTGRLGRGAYEGLRKTAVSTAR
jgi:hypothetical protein